VEHTQGPSAQTAAKTRHGVWLAAIIILVAGYVVYEARPVFTPLLAALAVAYVLNPAASAFQRRGIPRLAVVVGLFLILAVVVVLLFFWLVMPAVKQALALPQWLAGLADNESVRSMLQDIREKYSSQVHDFLSGLQKSAASYSSQVIQHAVVAFGTVAGSVLAVVSVLILLPLYTFFFLWRFDRVVGFLGGLIPGRHRDRVVLVVKQIDQTLASFFRGRLIVCGIVGVATAIGYLIAGVPFALVLGLLVGVLNLVPYLSVIVGLPITLVVCYLAHFDLAHPLYALIAFTVVQLLDNFFLTPVIQGKAVGLHPITMVVVLLIGSELAGLLGLILAVPAAAVIKILFREFVLPELKPAQIANCEAPAEPAKSEAETTDEQPNVPG